MGWLVAAAPIAPSAAPFLAPSASGARPADASRTDPSLRWHTALGVTACSAAAGLGVSVTRRRARPSRTGLRALEARRREALASVGVAVAVPVAAEAAGQPPTVARKAGDGIWMFDQAFGIPGLGVGANIPIRMTIMALEGGGYLIYNPCQPTAECLKAVKDFGIDDVRYIVLGTIAVEHKYYGPQWASQFPQAEVWISPRTFSYPVDFGAFLPVVGFKPGQAINRIPKDSSQAPWFSKGVDHLQLTVDYAPRTVFEETVMYHKRSGTFVCTDMIIGLSNEAPEILTKSPYREGLLWFSRSDASQEVDASSPATLRDGYQRSTLLLNNINPRSLLSVAAGDLTVPDQLGLAFKSPQKELGYFGWYPCNWQETDSKCAKLDQRESAEAGSKVPECRPGWRGEWQRLIAGVAGTGVQVPSFVAELQVSRDPEALRGFADEIARRWPGIKQAVPSHFDAPLPISADKVRKAISAATMGPPGGEGAPAARTADLSAILNFREYLEKNDLIYKPKSGLGQWKA